VQTVRVSNDDGESIDYCPIGDISTLIWVANLAAIELHVPLALAASPDAPTAMVFDLDAGEPARTKDCIEVACRIADLLKDMKLKCFAKLSGKKGLHLLVPLNTPDVTFDQTKSFAKAVAQVLSREDPKHVTAIMRKDDRHRKVFIDWNQNDRSKTMVCAYSLRAELTPKISWPFDLQHPSELIPTASTARLPGVDPIAALNSARQRLPASL